MYIYVCVCVCIYTILLFVLGLLQSTGWPTIVAIMGNWFGKGRFVFTYIVYHKLCMLAILLNIRKSN